jgi:hypothetical protein
VRQLWQQNTWWWPNTAETCRKINKKEKLIVALKTVHFSVYEGYRILKNWETYCMIGRAVAQAVSRWLPTAAARLRVRAACGVCGGQSGTGAGFLRVLRVSPANHSTNFSIIIITRGWHNRPLMAAVPSGPNWTPLPTIPIKKKLFQDFRKEETREIDGRLSQDTS